MDDVYVYLVERKSDGEKFAMVGNFKNRNIGCGKHLFAFVSPDYRYAQRTPYGLISNVTLDHVAYNRREYRVIHCTKVLSERCLMPEGDG
jgi:hypothetical protein